MSINVLINVAKSQLGMEEDDYRAMLADVTGGKDRLTQMSYAEKSAVVERLKGLGFQTTGRQRDYRRSSQGYQRLIHALWRSCHSLGVIDDKSRAALRTFCGKCIHGDDTTIAVDPDLMSYDQANRVIPALKAMEKRGKAARAK